MKHTFSRGAISLAWVLIGVSSSSAQEVIPVTVNVSEVRICWDSSPGLIYQVQHQSGGGAWMDLGGPLTATSSQTCVRDPYVPNRSYRALRVEAPPGPDPAVMAWIPPGAFLMGTPASEPARLSNEGPQTQVTITRGFWMDRFEVTQTRYLSLMGTNPSNRTGDLNRPVEQVTWHNATNFCGRLTERERLAGRLPAGHVYRLPTEAEWEYACRAGTTTPFHYGNELRSGMANFDGKYEYPPCPPDTNFCFNPNGIFLSRTAPVGGYAPNAWGLYDMHGNVYEWVQDWYSNRLPGGSLIDPQGPATHTQRIIRGGRYYFYSYALRSGWRGSHLPGAFRIDLGFRTVLAPVP